MNAPLTPLELAENEACVKIAEEVAEHARLGAGEFALGAAEAADRIRARIVERQRARELVKDPFTRCLYAGCEEEALGAFCAGHAAYLPAHVRSSLAAAIVAGDLHAYGGVVATARNLITEATVR